MWKDEIIEEIYRIREEHAKSFNYDLQAICDDLRQKQAVSNRQIISQPLKQPCRQHGKSLHPTPLKVICWALHSCADEKHFGN
ncbi:hypothetical protein [Nostoc sp.]|uniref:hypothetical protein n=1 Tax=Nostoc sp. TaxID=1180 RepID=UPI002FF5EA05